MFEETHDPPPSRVPGVIAAGTEPPREDPRVAAAFPRQAEQGDAAAYKLVAVRYRAPAAATSRHTRRRLLGRLRISAGRVVVEPSTDVPRKAAALSLLALWTVFWLGRSRAAWAGLLRQRRG